MDEKTYKKMTVQEAGHRGGTTTVQRYGYEHLRAISRQGGERVRQMLELAREVEKERTSKATSKEKNEEKSAEKDEEAKFNE